MPDQKPEIPFTSPVMPAALDEATQIQFRCYKGISCFNASCKQADVTLAPGDYIVRVDYRNGSLIDQIAGAVAQNVLEQKLRSL